MQNVLSLQFPRVRFMLFTLLTRSSFFANVTCHVYYCLKNTNIGLYLVGFLWEFQLAWISIAWAKIPKKSKESITNVDECMDKLFHWVFESPASHKCNAPSWILLIPQYRSVIASFFSWKMYFFPKGTHQFHTPHNNGRSGWVWMWCIFTSVPLNLVLDSLPSATIGKYWHLFIESRWWTTFPWINVHTNAFEPFIPVLQPWN